MPEPAVDADDSGGPASGGAGESGRGRGSASTRLDAVRGRLGVEPDGVVARSLGIARKTVVEYRKRHGIGAYGVAATLGETVASRRSSRLDSYAAIVGTLPDRVVAERAGVTPENVRMYRQRRGIPARWRDEAGEAAVTAVTAARPAGGRARGARRERGASRVDAALASMRELVGALSDAEVAARAGVSRSAVSAWRARHGIAGAVARRADDAAAPAAVPSAAAKAPAQQLWRVVAVRDGVRKIYGLLAAGPVEAATRAQAALGGPGGWSLRSLKVVGEALPE